MITVYRGIQSPVLLDAFQNDEYLSLRELRSQFNFNLGLSLLYFNTEKQIVDTLTTPKTMWNGKALLEFDFDKIKKEIPTISEIDQLKLTFKGHPEINKEKRFANDAFNIQEQIDIFTLILKNSCSIYVENGLVMRHKLLLNNNQFEHLMQ